MQSQSIYIFLVNITVFDESCCSLSNHTLQVNLEFGLCSVYGILYAASLALSLSRPSPTPTPTPSLPPSSIYGIPFQFPRTRISINLESGCTRLRTEQARFWSLKSICHFWLSEEVTYSCETQIQECHFWWYLRLWDLQEIHHDIITSRGRWTLILKAWLVKLEFHPN